MMGSWWTETRDKLTSTAEKEVLEVSTALIQTGAEAILPGQPAPTQQQPTTQVQVLPSDFEQSLASAGLKPVHLYLGLGVLGATFLTAMALRK